MKQVLLGEKLNKTARFMLLGNYPHTLFMLPLNLDNFERLLPKLENADELGPRKGPFFFEKE